MRIPSVWFRWATCRRWEPARVRPSMIGTRGETQLRQNLGTVGWSLTVAQMARMAWLGVAIARTAPDPYFPIRTSRTSGRRASLSGRWSASPGACLDGARRRRPCGSLTSDATAAPVRLP